MTDKELIFLGSCIIYGTKYKDVPIKENPRELACEDAADIYSRMPIIVKAARKFYKEEKEKYQISDKECK